MRLLDSISHCRTPLFAYSEDGLAAPLEVTGPSRYAQQLSNCPLRFVLGDDLTRASAELAFADGGRLASCLDLLRMPAPYLWVEWNDEVHKRVVYETQAAAHLDATASGRKVGVLLHASPTGLAAIGRTFWANSPDAENAEVTLSPLETHIDFSGEFAGGTQPNDILSGGFMDLTDAQNPATANLLNHVRFRFDPSWAEYYRDAAGNPDFKRRLIDESLATVGWDAPFLLAFLLLLSAKDATRLSAVSRAAINRKRAALGRPALLDHVEVNACLEAVSTDDSHGDGDGNGRQSPRLHHVRGHLVRRENRVFWRVPHLRGSGCRGAIRSRTVCLSFARRAEHEARV
jgi:hypothetical protein